MMVATNASDIGPAGPENTPRQGRHNDPLLDCLAILTRLHGRPMSAEALAAGMPLAEHRFTPSLFIRAAERHGYSARALKRPVERISNMVLPAILLLKDAGACVLTSLDTRARSAAVIIPETGIGTKSVPLDELKEQYSGYCIFVQPRPRTDERVHEERPRPGRFWFWGTLWRFKRYYLEAIVAAAVINILALATSLFIMNVYDRVVPNNVMETLLVLAIGVLTAIGFEFLARTMRGYFIDVSGKKADLLLAGVLFQQALGLRMEARPAIAGTFAAQLREYETLRDFFTSATLTTISDLPFVFFFIWIISLIGGPLYQVPLLAVPLVVIAGLIAQIPLAMIMRRYMRETALRHGVLVEAVEGMETLKSHSAEGIMQGRWENYTALTGKTATRSRLVSSLVVNFALLVQQAVTVIVVFWGVSLISEGALTVGGLIACVILSGRALAPLSQVAGLLARYQHARAALFMLDEIMHRPVERPAGRSFLHRPDLSGQLEFSEVSFAYPGQKIAALDKVSLHIRPGERVGILGRVGSGKSTLLRLLMGLYQPVSGAVLADGADIQQLDPTDLRRNLGYVSQDVRLFFGTLRDNVALGWPLAGDREVLEVARITGLDYLVARHPQGFDMTVGEGGEGLSGGQRQAVAIARALLPAPPILLLDEPTSSMDHSTEQTILAHLRRYLQGKTLVLVTHKPSMLALVERLIVLDQGRVVADGPRDKVLRALATPAGNSGAGIRG